MKNYNKIMKRSLSLLISFVMFIFFFTACVENKLDKEIAKVNDTKITYGDYLKEFALFKLTLDIKYGEDFWKTKPEISNESDSNITFLDQFKKEMLDRIILDEVVLQNAKKDKIKIAEKEISARLDQTMKNLNENEDLKKYYEDNGITKDFIKNIITNDLYRYNFEQNFNEKNKITDEELNNFYNAHKKEFEQEYKKEEIRASHILVKTTKEDGKEYNEEELKEAKKKIDDIYKKILDGGDFAQLAKEYSDCPSKSAGGDLGYFNKGMMVKEFDDVAFKTNVNSFSKPFKTPFGYHIVKVTDKKIEPIDEKMVKEYIRITLQRDKFENYIESLKKEAKISENDNLLKDVEKDLKPFKENKKDTKEQKNKETK